MARARYGAPSWIALGAIVVVAACSSSSSTTALSTPAPASTAAAPCQPPSPITTDSIPEVTGNAGAAQLHGLVMHQLPIHVGDDVKIVWRMTGTGSLTATAIGPDQGSVPLDWGPSAHESSSYNRPGDEWGVGYRFTQPGCWRLHLARADVAGDVWLRVEPLPIDASSTVTLTCADSIASEPAPPDDYTNVLDAVALPTTRALQAGPSGESDPKAALFAKAGLLVRAGATADIVMATDGASLGWGNPGIRTTHLRVPGCPGSAARPWLAFAGGFWSGRFQCASVVVATAADQRAVPIGIGVPCTGQAPVPTVPPS